MTFSSYNPLHLWAVHKSYCGTSSISFFKVYNSARNIKNSYLFYDNEIFFLQYHFKTFDFVRSFSFKTMSLLDKCFVWQMCSRPHIIIIPIVVSHTPLPRTSYDDIFSSVGMEGI